jgi:hypothetical protein
MRTPVREGQRGFVGLFLNFEFSLSINIDDCSTRFDSRLYRGQKTFFIVHETIFL